MDSVIQITVLVCTYNRAASLASCLESVAGQTLPESLSWEVLVVDNNSKDATRGVVEEFRQRYPGRFRYLLESRQGVSHARNAGVQNARGEIIAFIDDDETAAADWLWRLTANLHSAEWAGAGGRVIPVWTRQRPQWMSVDSAFTTAPLAAFERDPDKEQLNEPPFGANMAFRKEVFHTCGWFRVDLGRSGKDLQSNEDTEFGRRVLQAGRRLRYEPLSVTYHPVEDYRLQRTYFLQWWFNKGRSDARELGIRPERKNFLGVPLRSFRHVASEALRWMFAFNSSRRFIHKVKVWATVGSAYESYRQVTDGKRKTSKQNPDMRSPAANGG